MRTATRLRGPNWKHSRWRQRRGAVIVLVAVIIVALLGMVAFAVDVGYMLTVKTELQRAADAGALAAANALVEGAQPAEDAAVEFVKANAVGAHSLADDDIEVELGHWDEDTDTFAVSDETPSAVRVAVANPQQPLFFGRVLGTETFDTAAEAIAVYQPRDIQVVLDFSGSMSDDSELKSEGTLTAAVVNANLLAMYGELGSPVYGSLGWLSSSQHSSKTTSQTVSALGLSSVAYPYPSGSWSDYVSYVKKSSSNSLPTAYRHRYGYKTWINYLMEIRGAYNQTPSLWQTSEQPVTALKDSFSVFLSFLDEAQTDDRVGLTIYTSSDGTAIVEHTLTHDYALVETTAQHRQAGHYTAYTNIGDGIKSGRNDLVNNGRAGAFKLMVLMTDGLANRPTGVDPVDYAADQAQLCADAGIPVVTISLGSGADTDLMQDIADTTGGVHFNIPGGQTGAEYQEELEEVFRQVADDHPLKLVK